MKQNRSLLPNSLQKRSHGVVGLFMGILTLATGCVFPVPTAIPTAWFTVEPTITTTPEPYPMPVHIPTLAPRMYPGPAQSLPVLPMAVDAPSCVGYIEVPITIWTDGRDIYTDICVRDVYSSQVNLYDERGWVAYYYGAIVYRNVNGCARFRHYPVINGAWTAQALVGDASGVTLCDVRQAPLVRQWHLFPVLEIKP